MTTALESGQHLIVDRYAYSGIAFTSSKVGVPHLGLDWTTAPDRGLLAPDLVIFLDITAEDAAKRGEFGQERYEKKEIQDRVREVFRKLRLHASASDSSSVSSAGSAPAVGGVSDVDGGSWVGASFGANVEWSVVNAGQTREQVQAEILALAKKAIQTYATTPVRFL